tara:strand:+ start:195 stop:998 length:804 start_codon:yes stop_codon:yes gene_type:complete
VNNEKKNRISVGLCRVSSHAQENNTSLQFQEEKIEQYCKLHELKLSKIVSEVCSGSLQTRDSIEEVKELVKNNEIEVVVIWKSDRCFRSMLAFSKFYEFLKNHNVELRSVSEGLSSFSKNGSMLFGIMCSIAQYERELITERMINGKIAKVKSGIRAIGGKSVYGYKVENGKVVIDEESANAVKFIFKKANELQKQSLTKTKKTQKLLKSLKRKNLKFNGHQFTNRNVKSILSNSFYCGEMKYSDIVTKHNHETLISKRLFNSVQYV